MDHPAIIPKRNESSIRVCLLNISDELLAIDLRNVREVFEVDSVTPVPGVPAAIVGVANLRGMVIPLVDLRFLLRLPVVEPRPKLAVVVRQGAQQVGVLVDRVPEIRAVRREDFLPAPVGEMGNSKPFVSAILRVEDRIGGVVEIPTLLARMETGE